MAKIFTEVQLDKPRKMRFGYKVIKEMDQRARQKKPMTELEGLEYMIFMSLKEDDPALRIEDIEDILEDSDMEEVALKLEETIQRDMPGLAKQQEKTEPVGEEGKNE
jgi:hypothetical protein